MLNTPLNRLLPSGRRATIISLGSVVGCAMPAVAFPLLARIADVTSLQGGITVLGGGFFLLMAPILALLSRERWQEEVSTA